jgi:adenylate cyclase
MRALRRIGELRAAGRPLEAVVALHVGEVMYGNVGAEERLDFTVIGRAVNETARLQALTKQISRARLSPACRAHP